LLSATDGGRMLLESSSPKGASLVDPEIDDVNLWVSGSLAGGGPIAGRSPGHQSRSSSAPCVHSQEGQRGLKPETCSRSTVGRAEARWPWWATRAGWSPPKRGPLVSSEEGTGGEPRGACRPPVWTGGLTVNYVATTDQVAPGGRSCLSGGEPPQTVPLPKRRCTAVRSQDPEGSWTYSGNRAQARTIMCALSTSPRGHPAPEGDLEKRETGAIDIGRVVLRPIRDTSCSPSPDWVR